MQNLQIVIVVEDDDLLQAFAEEALKRRWFRQCYRPIRRAGCRIA